MENLEIREITLDSREVAKMVEKGHNDLLKDIRQYMAYLAEGKIPHSDFFQENQYKDKSGKANPCYDITRKGCEFIANKLTGQKGTLFTASYINRFHEMEKGTQSKLPPDKNKRLEIQGLNAKTRLKYAQIKEAEHIAKSADKLKPVLSPEMYATLHIQSLEVILGANTLPRPKLEQKLIDATCIAEKLGIYSNSGLPHPSAVGAIIAKLDISEDERFVTAYERNGHQGSTVQYVGGVLDKVSDWLELHNWPGVISGNGKRYKISYRKTA